MKETVDYLPCANPLRGAPFLVEEGEAKLNDFQQVNIAPQQLKRKGLKSDKLPEPTWYW